MSRSICKRALPLALALAAGSALADHDGERGRAVSHTLWQQECGSCHVPYPPRLLPAASWNAVMDGLAQHFGTDASLAPDEAASIRQFLVTNAGRRGAIGADGKPLLRITATPWFRHAHSEELPASVWKRKEIGAPSNCGACHAGAAQGDFSEHQIRIPGGRR